MNNWKVLQRPVGTKLLAKCNGNQLQILTDVMHELISSMNNFKTMELPVAIISAVGQPSTGKTAYADAIMRQFQSITTLCEGEFMMAGFPDPKDFQNDDRQKFDGILVSAPPFIVEDTAGRRTAVILLDVWNNGTMTEDVYVKLIDLCFYVSSIRIVTAGGPRKQISWWVGDRPAVSNEQEDHHWLTVTNSLSKDLADNEASGSYLVVMNGQNSVRKLCRSIPDMVGGRLDIFTSDLEFIMEQIFSPQTDPLGCRLSGLVTHFKHGLAFVNNPQFTAQPELPVNEKDEVGLLATTKTGMELRAYNQQFFDAELNFAKTALSSSFNIMQKLQTDHLRKHKIMTHKELSDAFDSLCTTVTQACSSMLDFSLNDVWEAAWKDLQPLLEDCLSRFLRQNHNVIRKWDLELHLAIEKSTLLYNQQMDRCLPNYKLSAEEFDQMHSVCAQHTLDEFTVSSQVNEETRKYWKRVLELSKLEEWKHGYALLNEKKKLPPPPTKMAAALGYGNSEAILPDLACCHVGIYFGPEVVIFMAVLSTGPQAPSGTPIDFPVTLEIKPYLAFRRGKIIYGEQALKMKSRSGLRFNIFSSLAQFPQPTNLPSSTVEINGQKVSLTPEAIAVLFFREAIKQLTGITGWRVQTCTVAHPAQLLGEATTMITETLKIAGFSKVNLIPITTSLSLLYVQPILEGSAKTATKRIEFVTVYQATEILEISLVQLTGNRVEVKSFHGLSDFGQQRKEVEIFAKRMRKYLTKLAPKDLFATVLMLGTEDKDNALVHDALIKVVGDLNCPHNLVEYSYGMAMTVAKIDAGVLANNYWFSRQGLSRNSRLPPTWDREALKAQVEHLVRLLDPGAAQQNPQKGKVTKEKEDKIAEEVDSLRYQLAELVKQVQEALEKSSAFAGPLYGFINQSVQQCHQLLQIATISDVELTMAMKKLQIRSEDLLKESTLM